MNDLQQIPQSLPELPLDPPAQTVPTDWCIVCGQEFTPVDHDHFCNDCLAATDFEPFAARANDLAEEAKRLNQLIDLLKGEVRSRMAAPGTHYRNNLEVVWRSYPRSQLDIKRLRKEEPTVYENYASIQQVDAIYINRVDTD